MWDPRVLSRSDDALTLSRSHALRLSRSDALTLSRSHALTLSRSHALTGPLRETSRSLDQPERVRGRGLVAAVLVAKKTVNVHQDCSRRERGVNGVESTKNLLG